MLLAIYFTMGALAIECQSGEAAASKCTSGKCESVGDTQICTSCETGNVPVNGVCIAHGEATVTGSGCTKASNGAAVDQDDTQCGKCGNGYFLFKGGCYDASKAPGNLICSTIEESAPGMCKTCAPGYFKNPASTGNDATKQSCIACSDETGANDNTGVANCATCDPPETPGQNNSPQKATCTKCDQTKYLKEGACVESSGCAPDTEFAKQDSVNGNRCVSCGNTESGVDGCAKCTASSGESTKPTCTECNNNKIVKMEPSGTSCVEEAACVDGFFVETVSGTPSKKCTACADSNCAVCKK
ncbi:VSP [Giardia duodenalis ATCC 50581]|uniref:VSP n=1 Tax=Giardia intestinalis (strain ATCC 50581 / GS clone H7) TaxID=598745 RepID=C6LUN4_GIAIB|nr:VSP [Giardia intestinalis ATCC 50581]